MRVNRAVAAVGAMAPERAVAREQVTIEVLFRRHRKDVLRVVRRLLGPKASDADVEDVAQQAFIDAHRGLARFRGDSSTMTWMYGIASRAVLMHLRSWRRRMRTLAAFIEEWRASEERGPSVEDALAGREELERVWRCLERIKPKKRIVFILHEVEGLSGAEIAEALEIPVATVWTRLHHARRELVEAMRTEGAR